MRVPRVVKEEVVRWNIGREPREQGFTRRLLIRSYRGPFFFLSKLARVLGNFDISASDQANFLPYIFFTMFLKFTLYFGTNHWLGNETRSFFLRNGKFTARAEGECRKSFR